MIPVVLSFRRDGLTRSLRPWLERSLVLLLLAVCCLTRAGAQSTEPFELRDGDRVVFVGDTLVERERNQGWLEFSLSTRFPDRRVTFRNLGWSADTPQGQSRVGFDHSKPPEFWFGELTNSIAQLRPTVVFLGYGMANSFQGEPGMPAFVASLERLMNAIQQNTGAPRVRWVLLSPIPHERLPAPLPDPLEHNRQLEICTRALQAQAVRHDAHFVNLFQLLAGAARDAAPLTDDGIHLTDGGYRRAAAAMRVGLNWPANGWQLQLAPAGASKAERAQLRGAEVQAESAKCEVQPNEIAPAPGRDLRSKELGRIQVAGLKSGRYDVRVDGTLVGTHSASELKAGVAIQRGAWVEQAHELQQAIHKKNELFFYRWRPQNNTYLFLFRKYEQGQNAKEIPQFDPLIEEQERRIDALRRPRPHQVEVTRTRGEPVPAPVAAKAPEPAPLTPLPQPQFDLGPDLEISLYAENPLLAKPIHMNFDAQGRLWVASSEVYPQIKPGQTASDKILILEDTDHDGRAEKSTVFADGLLIPTGVLPGDGGVYVGASTELLYFRDTDGDGRADQRRVVVSAFGTEDTHHILHTLRWGLDGQLYMNQSIYIHTHAETPHGVIRLNSGGILNLRVPTMELGIHMKGLVNSWGHAIDEWGQSFATDGASSADVGQGGLFHVVPQAMYLTYAGARRILTSASPGSYPKFCGLEYVRSPQFPDDWQGNFVTCDFRAHRVVRFAMDEKDSTYVTRELPDLVRTKDVAFRPIDIKLGPDGALYIADWSNPIIQHGEVDFRDPRRDHEHGRIWRVSYKGRAAGQVADLSKLNNRELLERLRAPNEYIREQSRRLLVERGAKVVSDLNSWTRRQTAESQLLEALWLYQGLDRVEPKLLERLLEAQDGRVRAAAVRVLAFWQERVPAEPFTPSDAWKGWAPAPLPLARKEIPMAHALELLGQRIKDAHPRVRLETLRALARLPDAHAAELALMAADQPMDKQLEYALWLTINDLANPWIAALKAKRWKPEGREKQLEYGLQALEPARAGEVLGQLLGEEPLPRNGAGPWISLLGQAGTPKELRRLFEQVVQGGFDERAAARALAALNQAARLRTARPTGSTAPLAMLLTNASPEIQLEAVRLAGAWKDGGSAPKLTAQAGAKESSPALRQAAFGSLREIGGRGVIESLGPLVAPGTEPALRRQAVLALAALDFGKATPAAVELLQASSTDAEALALWRSLLSLKGSGPALARALPKSGLGLPMAKAGLRAAREGGRSEPDLVLALTRGSGIDEGDVALTEAELKQLVADVQQKGDPVRGEEVYRRKELSCVSCHSIGGAGGKVGPDMTSIGASAPLDYLIESVWFPNRKVKEGYHAVMVETKDGQEFSGVLVRENTEEVVLRDATGKETAVAKQNISDRRIGTLSLMPAGLIDALTPQERVDLFRFLSELGKPGAFDATKGNVARVWRVRPGIHTLEQFGEEKFVSGDLNGRDWLPVVANVDGQLPAARILDGGAPGRYLGLIGLYAGARMQLAQEGKVDLKFSGAPVAVWVDGKALAASASVSAEMAAGMHSVVVRLDPKKLPPSLRLEASAGTFLAE
jgi:putative membrane-bound dehydrogenase-like protein